MELAQFETLLATHGADLAVWPRDLGQEATRLVLRSGEAARLRDEAAQIDRALSGLKLPVSAEETERLLAFCADIPDRDDGQPANRSRPFIPAALLAACLLLGILLGSVTAAPSSAATRDAAEFLTTPSLAGLDL